MYNKILQNSHLGFKNLINIIIPDNMKLVITLGIEYKHKKDFCLNSFYYETI